jgi:acyl-CoA thioesterase
MEDDRNVDEATIRTDPFCDLLGIEFLTIEPGYAEATLTVSDELLNFNGTPHGGIVFSLADAAASAAENAKGRPTLGLETSTSFLAAAEVGDTLTARAESTHESNRTTQTSVVVTTGAGEKVATFTSRGYKP